MSSPSILRGMCGLTVASLLVASASPARGEELKRRGMIGVQLQPVPGEAPDGPPGKGAMVAGIVPNSAAAEAGLEPGDRITKIADKEVPDFQNFTVMMRAYYGGDTVELTILRGKDKKEELTKKITLRPRVKETSDEYEVLYDSVTAEGNRLRAYVTKPNGDGKHPAVIIVPTPQPAPLEFAGPMAEHPFRKAIAGLTKAGYVTLRIDRPGIGDSDGQDPRKTTLKMDVAAYKAGIEKLKTLPYVDGNNIFLFSHGVGSAIVALTATDAPVRGVACYAATVVRPPTQSFVEQVKRLWELETVKEEEIAKRTTMLSAYLEHCAKPGTTPGEVLTKYPELQAALRNVGGADPESVFGIYKSYYQDLAGTDFVATWGKVTAPVISLWGEADFQANKDDCEAIAKAAKKGEFKSLQGIDHVCNKAEDQEDSYLSGMQGGDFNPIIVETLVEWMKKNSKS